MLNVSHGNSVDGGAADTAGRRPDSIGPALIDQLNRGYFCPPDAGPMWRAAWEAGVDMSLIEDALQLTSADRLREHQRALNQILAMIEVGRLHEHDSGS